MLYNFKKTYPKDICDREFCKTDTDLTSPLFLYALVYYQKYLSEIYFKDSAVLAQIMCSVMVRDIDPAGMCETAPCLYLVQV